MMNPMTELAEVLTLMRDDPAAAADRLERMGNRLLALAARLRQAGGTRDRGGSGDRVQVSVVGPDGHVRQRADTGEIR